jgi:pimeloyl-ACP methyl ester carboxylesterase
MEYKCKVIKVVTPLRYELNGLWFGVDNPKRVVIFIHGLTSSAFSNLDFVVPAVDDKTAVITFNNRGHDKIARIKRIDKRKKKGYISEYVGEAHEVFTDCVDDLQGVIDFASENGVSEIYLAGHSTGCQKVVYYLSQRGKQSLVKGSILMCPMSDYAGALKHDKDGELEKVQKIASKMVAEGCGSELLPLDVWSHQHDAQRFLSLYTPDSKEEIFSYAQPIKVPKTLKKVKIPTLVIFAEKDDYRDRPIKQIYKWFEKNVKSKERKMVVIKDALHSFQGKEKEVSIEVKQWLSNR